MSDRPVRDPFTRRVRGPYLAAVVPLFLTGFAGCGHEEPPTRGDPVTRALDRDPVVLRVDSLLARVTALDSARPIERAGGLLVREGEVLVTDASAGRVYRFDWDGSPVGTAGSPGRGPGELVQPTVLRAVGESAVAVLDQGASRIVVYRLKSGRPPVTVTLRNAATSFAPGREKRFLVPSSRPDAFLDVAAASTDPQAVPVTEALPSELSTLSPVERAGYLRLLLAPGANDSSVHVVKNFDRLAVWRLMLDADSTAITGARRLSLPMWLVEAYDRAIEEKRAELEEHGLSLALVNSVSSDAEGRLWMTTGPIDAVGVQLPVAGEGRPRVVMSASGERGQEQRRGLVHAAVRGDRLFAVYGIELRIYRLERTDESVRDVL